jgi:hypothetical protein
MGAIVCHVGLQRPGSEDFVPAMADRAFNHDIPVLTSGK